MLEGSPAYYVSQLGIAAHYRDLSKGLIDSRDLIYFLSVVWLALLALVPTLLYYFSVYKLGSPEGNIDSAATVGSYLGLALTRPLTDGQILGGKFLACLLLTLLALLPTLLYYYS